MKIRYDKDPNKSDCQLPFASIENFELSGLIIITGVNGSGKSQFLRQLQGLIPPQAGKFAYQPVLPAGGPTFQLESSLSARKTLPPRHSALRAALNRLVLTHDRYYDDLFNLIPELREIKRTNPQSEIFLDDELLAAEAKKYISKTDVVTAQNQRHALSEFLRVINSSKIIRPTDDRDRHLIERCDIDIVAQLLKLTFFGHKITDAQIEGAFKTISQQKSFYEVFWDYLKQKETEFLEAANSRRANGGTVEVSSIFEPSSPWKRLDVALESAGFKYRVYRPSVEELSFRLGHDLTHAKSQISTLMQLASPLTNQPVPINALSRGEQVLMNIVIQGVVGDSGFYKQHTEGFPSQGNPKINADWPLMPNVFRLDEPDAHLDPRSIKTLLTYLREELVAKQGHLVIMTSHSLATLALAQADEIYVIEDLSEETAKGRHVQLRQVPRQEALNRLNAELETLEVGFRDEHYVFVESSKDVERYEILYQSLNRKPAVEVALRFVGTGLSDAEARKVVGGHEVEMPEEKMLDTATGCVIVKKLLKSLENNTNTFGLVDWDGGRGAESSLHVLAPNVAYAIENLLLDPLLIVAAAIKTSAKCRTKTFAMLNMPEVHEVSELAAMSTPEKQQIVDKVSACLFDQSSTTPPIVRQYQGEFSLNVNTELRDMKGHDYADLVLAKFQGLKSHDNADGIMKFICDELAPRHPDLFPKAIDEAFSALERGDQF